VTTFPDPYGGTPDGTGPLTRSVLKYDQTIRRLVVAGGMVDWTPLAAFVAVDSFKRIGTFLEEQDWDGYTTMLSAWASAVESFDTTVRRISEVDSLVYYEIEERHRHGNDVNVINSMTVFGFDEDEKINRLDVYLQQAR
jgi:hypothetical protein